MKGNNILRKLAAVLVVGVMALMAIGPTPVAGAGNSNPGIIPPQAHAYGQTYREWEASFWHWLWAIPTPINPEMDQTGANCAVGQAGDVWFLASTFGFSAERSCTIPQGKALLINIIGVECSAVEPDPFHGDNEAEMRACAHGIADQMTVVELTVDGVPINDLTNYRFDTPLYTINYPADNMLGVPGPGSTLSVGDGYFVMLAPLSTGQHTIYALGGLPSVPFTSEVTWHLTIGH